MRPYGVRMSPRPGCACCNYRDLHFFRGMALTERRTAAKRAAKKRARLVARSEINQQLQEMLAGYLADNLELDSCLTDYDYDGEVY